MERENCLSHAVKQGNVFHIFTIEFLTKLACLFTVIADKPADSFPACQAKCECQLGEFIVFAGSQEDSAFAVYRELLWHCQ